MGMPVNYPKPDLSRLSSREIQISTNRQTLEMDLHEWVAEVVRHTKQPPEKGFRAETILMATAKDRKLDKKYFDLGAAAAPSVLRSPGSFTSPERKTWATSTKGRTSARPAWKRREQ